MQIPYKKEVEYEKNSSGNCCVHMNFVVMKTPSCYTSDIFLMII